jgi:hypothetical protein
LPPSPDDVELELVVVCDVPSEQPDNNPKAGKRNKKQLEVLSARCVFMAA